MKVQVRHSCEDFDSCRAARVKSLFNAESGASFKLDADLPVDDPEWSIGLVVGPSGSGKTSIGRQMFGDEAFYTPDGWPDDAPIVDAIGPGDAFDVVTAALGTVGLGSVPAWLRPYHVLSNGERFRADLARILAEAPDRIVIDEFTSVVDRQIAKIGALAFAKGWRRTSGQAVLLSCHYDIIEWLEPDWVYDTATHEFKRGCLWRRPQYELEIWQTDWRYWDMFEPHHYLKVPHMIASTPYVGTVDGEPVAHLAVSTTAGVRSARASRLVVMPEWQGAGVGTRFLNVVCEMWLQGENRYGKRLTTFFHTSHPQLCMALRRDKRWRQTSATLYGGNKRRSRQSLGGNQSGYGGHFRAIQGFRYFGQAGVEAKTV